MDKDIPTAGKLSTYRLSHIIINLNKQRKTGFLTLKKEDIKKKFFFRNGVIVFASSNHLQDKLINILLKDAQLTTSQYEKCMSLSKNEGGASGSLLVQSGLFTPKELYARKKQQFQEIIYSVFNWDDGFFKFKEDILPEKRFITFKIDTGYLVYEGLKRIENWSIIHEDMSDFNLVFKVNNTILPIFKQIALDQKEKDMLKIVTEKENIRDIIENSSIDSYSAMKIVYILYSLGFIQKKQFQKSDNDHFESHENKEVSIEDLKKKTDALLNRIDRLDYYQILGVESSCTHEKIKKAYNKTVKVFHPDRYYSSLDKSYREKLHTILTYINRAFHVLGCEDKRAQYDNGELKTENRQSRVEKQFHEGIVEMKKGNFWAASEMFKIAAGFAPDKALYWSNLSITLSKLPNKLKEAEEAIQKAISLEPKNPNFYVTLGDIYYHGGMIVRAKKQFEKALRIAPNNERANKGMELVITY